MKRLLSILLFCAMVLTMLPAPAFAEDVCICKDPCTAENMNSDCPVCGAEGAAPENCAQAANLSDDTPDPDPVTQFTVTWDGNGGTVDTTGATTSAAAGTAITPPANNPLGHRTKTMPMNLTAGIRKPRVEPNCPIPTR